MKCGPRNATSSKTATTNKKSKKTPKKEPLSKECQICYKQFMYSNDLRKHLRIHSDERPYSCVHCDKKFRQAGCLKNHIACQHGTNTVFTCYYCNKSFPIKERLRLHMRLHSGEKPYKCTMCPKEFARGGQITQHMVTHFGWKKYRCSLCTASFAICNSLKHHMKVHFNIKEYVCEICGKNFVRRDALIKHLSCFHKNEKAFYCEICRKTLKGHLPQHMRTHNKQKTFECSDCNATFAQNSQLKVHARIHSGERPYRCKVCWQTFGHSSVLKLHIRKHTGEKPFKCPVCVETETSFSQLPHLKTHMRTIHQMDKSYLCNECNEYFKTKNDLQQHMITCKSSKTDNGSIGGNSTCSSSSSNSNTNVNSNALTQMRLSVAVLLKKITTEDRLKQLGYEKRLIDNVLIGALKASGQQHCEDMTLSDADRLRANVRQFLEWTIPAKLMIAFTRQQKSVEELLEELTFPDVSIRN